MPGLWVLCLWLIIKCKNMEKEIIEGNKLIAEFMEIKRDKRRKDFSFPYPVIEIVPAEMLIGYGHVPEEEIKHYSGTPDMMKYHSSWDWLTPVVNRIIKQKNYLTIDTSSILETWKHVVKYISNQKENGNNLTYKKQQKEGYDKI